MGLSQKGTSGFTRGSVAVLLAAFFCILFQVVPLRGQNTNRLPIISKLSSGNHQQAFTGKIQSLNLKERVLNVNSLRGKQSEIFPVKKSVRVEGINGNRMKLTDLGPGMTVLIYFDQRSGKRTVRNIIVLTSKKNQGKNKRAHSS